MLNWHPVYFLFTFVCDQNAFSLAALDICTGNMRYMHCVLANQWVDIFMLNDNKHLLDEAMSNMNIYSVEPRNIRRG